MLRQKRGRHDSYFFLSKRVISYSLVGVDLFEAFTIK